MVGRHLSRYRIDARLGAGGMGVVYRAHDPRLGRDVAIKLLPPAQTGDPAARQRFLQEARAVAALEHPNVCAIYEVDETAEGEIFLVMPLYEGATLDRREPAGPAPLAWSVAILAQVADGLARAHARGIVHRDIKPSNVMVSPEGVARILDFGLARMHDATRLTATATSLGTPAYMAPEQVRGETVDARADVWSCGVLLYFLLAGRPPFVAEQAHAVLYAILNAPLVPIESLRPDVPPALARLIAACLDRDPDGRPADGAALAAALREVLGTLDPDGDVTLALSAVTTARVQAARPPARDGAQRRAWIWPAVAVALVTLAGVGWTQRDRLFPREPLRVAVLAPTVESPGDSLQRADLGAIVQALTVRGLANLSGISVIDPSELRGLAGPPADVARAVSADEVVTPTLRERGDEWQLHVSRLDGATGTVRGAIDFTVPRDEPLSLADALSARLAGEYRGHRPRAPLAASAAVENFRQWVSLRRAFLARDGGGLDDDELRERIEALRRAEPRFLEVHLLEADLAMRSFLTTREPARLAEATEAAGRAQALAPADPRPHVTAIRAALEGDRMLDAERHLATLRRVAPGDAAVSLAEARLAEKRGDHDAALAALERLVRRRPSRTHLTQLADLEFRIGRYDAARGHLDTLRARHPDDRYPLSKLAELELLYGRAARAETLYAELIERTPSAAMYWSNRGLSRMLQQRAGPAAEDFRAAEERSPGVAATQLNLADAELLLGHDAEARRLYGEVLAGLEAEAASDAGSLMLQAQCLARLGRMRDAVAVTQKALATAGDDSEVHYLAALVYTLAGEQASATVHAEKAVQLGVGARWFGFPWFDGIRGAIESSPAAK